MSMFIITLLMIILLLFLICCNKNKEKYATIPIWTYWENTDKNNKDPPKVVQRCYKNWKDKGKLNNINILNPDNIKKFIPEDEYNKICKNAENLAVKSDFISLYLLYKYGGVWIDGSVFLNKPLLDWLPTDKMFTYRADRFKDLVVCMETFFIYSPKNNIICKTWYDLLHKIAENEGKDNFIKNVKKKYPNITNSMPSNYLWVYVVGKYLLLKNPDFINMLNTKSAEEGPWYESERNGWENVDQICKALSKKEPCTTCELTKLHNGLREKCGAEVVT